MPICQDVFEDGRKVKPLEKPGYIYLYLEEGRYSLGSMKETHWLIICKTWCTFAGVAETIPWTNLSWIS